MNSVNSLNFYRCINLIIQFSESRKSNRPPWKVWNFHPNLFRFQVVVMIMMMVVLPNYLMFIRTNWEKSVLFQKFWKTGIFVIVNNWQESLINWAVMWNAFQYVSLRSWRKLMEGFLFYLQCLNMFLVSRRDLIKVMNLSEDWYLRILWIWDSFTDTRNLTNHKT